jgi:hypothetical protein
MGGVIGYCPICGEYQPHLERGCVKCGNGYPQQSADEAWSRQLRGNPWHMRAAVFLGAGLFALSVGLVVWQWGAFVVNCESRGGVVVKSWPAGYACVGEQ